MVSHHALGNERWSVPQECGSQAQFESAIRARIDGDADSLLAETNLSIRADSERYTLTVRVGEQLRTLTDTSCQDLFRAAVVVAIALYNAPESFQENRVQPLGPASESVTPPQASTPIAPPSLVNTKPYPIAQSQPKPQPARAPELPVGAEFGLIAGLLPELTTAFGPFMAYDFTDFGFEATARFLPPQETRDDERKGVRVYGLGGAISFYYKPDRIIGIGTGLFAYRLTGRGLGSKDNTSSNVVALGPQFGLWVIPFELGPLYARLGADALFPVARPRFEILDYKEVFRSSAVTFQGYLQAGYRFR